MIIIFLVSWIFNSEHLSFTDYDIDIMPVHFFVVNIHGQFYFVCFFCFVVGCSLIPAPVGEVLLGDVVIVFKHKHYTKRYEHSVRCRYKTKTHTITLASTQTWHRLSDFARSPLPRFCWIFVFLFSPAAERRTYCNPSIPRHKYPALVPLVLFLLLILMLIS